MMSDSTCMTATEANRAISATRLSFFGAGFILSSWAPLVPLVKQASLSSNAQFGLLLLTFGIGSLLMMPLAGILAARLGCRCVLLVAVVISVIAMPWLVVTSSPSLLACCLFMFGIGIGAQDVVINIHAVALEKAVQRPIMSGVHALFSLGGMCGSAGTSALLLRGLAPLSAVLCVIAILALITLASYPRLLPYATPSATDPWLVMPKGIVLLLGLLCFIAYIMEGTMLDWGGIYLTSQHLTPINLAGIGYALFAAAMTSGRFAGDVLIKHAGRRHVFLASATTALLGYLMLVLAPIQGLGLGLGLGLAGFVAIGLGLANLAPMLFTAAGQQHYMPGTLAVAAVSSMGYTGILLGPALVGTISQWSSLLFAFSLISLLATLFIISLRWIRF